MLSIAMSWTQTSQAAGYTSLEALMTRAGWVKPRADAALDSLLRQVAAFTPR